MIITVTHMREYKLCMVGVRRFFENHNLDFRDFVKNGIDSSLLINTNDEMAIKVVKFAQSKGE